MLLAGVALAAVLECSPQAPAVLVPGQVGPWQCVLESRLEDAGTELVSVTRGISCVLGRRV